MSTDSGATGVPRLHIRLLGRFGISLDDQELDTDGWRLRKAKDLIKILALEKRHRLHKEQILEKLWPDIEPTAATNNLHQALHIARKALQSTAPRAYQSHYLNLKDEILSLGPEEALWVDVDAFQAAASLARLSDDPAKYDAALDLYTGDLLPDDRYEEWAAEPREALRQEYLRVLMRLARLHVARGVTEQAVQALRRVISSEQTHEEAYLALMRLYAAGGERRQALYQYQLLEESLRRELGIEPSEEARNLRDAIAEGDIGFPQHVLHPVRHASAFAPAKHALRNNLPVELSTFVGREREKSELLRLIERTRLVTLTGPGGCGKSRLAIQAARLLITGGTYPPAGNEQEGSTPFSDGVYLVEFAPLSEAALVPRAVASALGVGEIAGDPVDALVSFLRDRSMLLLLDNCEHLIDSVARLSDTLLATCPDLAILATSREPMHISGEISYLVPSLSLPPHESLQALAQTARSEAVRLFLDRASAVDPAFALTEENAPVVAEICRRLDGMPLAIELAAARVKALSIEQIASRLDDLFHLLTGGSRTALTRQQTLKATLDWSYDLLSEKERVLFRRLSVFAGGFGLEAVEAICSDDILPQVEVLDLLAQLIDKSLVTAQDRHGIQARYRLLEPVAQYAQVKLQEAGETLDIRQRHLNWYMDLASRVEPELWGPRQLEWLERLDMEHDNLRAALGWSTGSDPESGLRIATALWQFWLLHGHIAEGRERLVRLLGRAPRLRPDDARLRARALTGELAFAVRMWEPTAFDTIAEQDRVYQSHNDLEGQSRTLHLHGIIAWMRGRASEVDEALDGALALARRNGSRAVEGIILHSLGVVALFRGDNRGASSHLQESLAIFGALGDEPLVSHLFVGTGWVPFRYPEYSLGRLAFEEILVVFRAIGARTAAGRALSSLSDLARYRHDLAAAYDYLDRALATVQATGDSQAIGHVLGKIGSLATYSGDHDTARDTLGRSLEISRKIGDKINIVLAECRMGNLSIAEGSFDEARRLFESGLTLSRDISYRPGIANATIHLGNLASLTGDHEAAILSIKRSIELYDHAFQETNVLAWGGIGRLDLAAAYINKGDLREALVTLEDCISILKQVREDRTRAAALYYMGDVLHSLGDDSQAWALLLESLELFQKIEDPLGPAYPLEALAELAISLQISSPEATDVESSSCELAVRLIGAASAIRDQVGEPPSAREEARIQRVADKARARLGAEGYAKSLRAAQRLR